MLGFVSLRKAMKEIKSNKDHFNCGYSMGLSKEKRGYNQDPLCIRFSVIQVENALKNYFAKTFGESSYVGADSHTKSYISSMGASRIQHYKIDKYAKKIEACFNARNLKKFFEQVKKMQSISESKS
ncbi:MAG: hypothetical protein REH83_02000 [Rickettsiella sp.]|nr:hypothetical protein [Rickettsiella sp.]